MANDRTILSIGDIDAAKNAVAAYISTCDGIFKKMKSTIEGLTASGSNFNGDASIGYVDFFGQITPALTDKLYVSDESLMKSIEKMLDSIRETLIGTVDPELGNANKNAGADGAGNVTVGADIGATQTLGSN